jgi:hypothetical protein
MLRISEIDNALTLAVTLLDTRNIYIRQLHTEPATCTFFFCDDLRI